MSDILVGVDLPWHTTCTLPYCSSQMLSVHVGALVIDTHVNQGEFMWEQVYCCVSLASLLKAQESDGVSTNLFLFHGLAMHPLAEQTRCLCLVGTDLGLVIPLLLVWSSVQWPISWDLKDLNYSKGRIHSHLDECVGVVNLHDISILMCLLV